MRRFATGAQARGISPQMDFFDDLRDPRTAVGKVFLTVTFLLLLSFLAILAISGFVLRGVLWPERASKGVDPNSMLSPPDLVPFSVPGGKPHEGWLFPGLSTAPVIILCHGYRSQRSDLLTMVTPLQEHQYNVFIFDFSGHGSVEGSTSLGPREAAALRAAIDELSRHTDLDGSRVGVWGSDLGGYAALVAAAGEPRIKALAVDSVYDRPEQFLSVQIERQGVTAIPLVGWFTRMGFRLLHWSERNEPPLSTRVLALHQTAKLFIQGRDNPVLADATLQLFLQSPEPRAQAVFQRTSYSTLPNDAKREYERQLLNFFLEHLPTTAPPAGN